MPYFDESFTRFLKNLKKHNDREWFLKNKEGYEKSVKIPFEKLIEDLIKKIKKSDPGFELAIKDSIFRLHRDVRFSKDKSPYKTYVSAVIGLGGRKNMADPGMYLQLEENSIMLFEGVYMPEKEPLYKIRAAILDHPNEVDKLNKDKKFVTLFGKVQGEVNKVLPPEFKEAAKQQPLLANKQFYFTAKYDGQALFRKDLVDFILKHHEAARPWNEFLYKAIHA